MRDFDSRELGFDVAQYAVTLEVAPPPPPSLPYKVGTSRPSLRTNRTRLVPLQVAQGTLRMEPAGAVGISLTEGSAGCADCARFAFQGTMCSVNSALAQMGYLPKPYYNSGFGQAEAIQLTVRQVGRAGAPATLTVHVKVRAVNNVPRINLHLSGADTATVDSLHLDFLLLDGAPEDGRLGDCGAGRPTGCIAVTDPDACETMYTSTGALPAPGDTLAVQQSATAVCRARNASSTAGHVSLTFSTVFGDVLFYPSYLFKQWPPRDELVAPAEAGKQSRLLTVTQPLAAFHGGVLRYYGSATLRRLDTLTVSADDKGNSGKPGAAGFCCCADAACSACAPPPCTLQLDVTTCEKVEGFTCKDAITGGQGLVGWGVAAIVIVLVLLAGAGLLGVVYYGALKAANITPQAAGPAEGAEGAEGAEKALTQGDVAQQLLAV